MSGGKEIYKIDNEAFRFGVRAGEMENEERGKTRRWDDLLSVESSRTGNRGVMRVMRTPCVLSYRELVQPIETQFFVGDGFTGEVN